MTLPPHYHLESLLVGWVPFALAEEPPSALVVGLGAGVTVDLMLKMGLPRVSVAEIEPRVIEAVDVVFAGENPASDPRVSLEPGDARQFLLARRASEGCDIITSMPAHPWVTPNLYTREFFATASQNLSEDGLFSLWLGVWRVDNEALESVVRAFVSVFPHYVIFFVPETEAYYFVGSRKRLDVDIASYTESSGLEDELLDDPYFLFSRIYATGDGRGSVPPGVASADDRVLFDRQPPQEDEEPARLESLLPHEYLIPELVPHGKRRAIFSELLERLLGSERGELPRVAAALSPDRAERTLQAVRESFSESERAYFRGHIALARGAMEEARVELERAAEHEGAMQERARKFVALTYPPRSKERLAALADVHPTTDVLVELFELDSAVARARVPARMPPPEEDAIGWVLYKLANKGSWEKEDAPLFSRYAGPELLRTARVGLLSAAVELCSQHDLDSEEIMLTRALQSAASELARYFTAEGLAAGAERRYQDAARLLWEANRVEPANDRHVRHLLHALVATSDALRLEELLDQLRFLGRSEAQIRFLLDEAHAGRPRFDPMPVR